MKPLLFVGLVLLLLGIGSAGSSPLSFAENKHTGNVPLLPLVASCIDFDASSQCCPFAVVQGQAACGEDGDAYSRNLELLVGSDPNDPQSTPEYGLFDEQMRVTTCRDGLDNDLDGLTDRQDPGCRVTCHSFVAGNACTDQDHDGWLKYIEDPLGSDPKDSSSTPESLVLPVLLDTCTDGIDNDRDGLIDALDPSCDLSRCIDFDADNTCGPF